MVHYVFFLYSLCYHCFVSVVTMSSLCFVSVASDYVITMFCVAVAMSLLCFVSVVAMLSLCFVCDK